MKTKTELLDTMEAHGACYEATLYVLTHDSDSALEIGLDCSRVDWLIWLLVYEGVSLTDFVAGCAERAKKYVAHDVNYAADAYAVSYAADAYAFAAAAEAATNAAATAGYSGDYAYAAERKSQLTQLHAPWTEWCKS